MAETTISIVQVLPNTKIAQLILLPYKKDGKVTLAQLREAKGFDSSDHLYWSQIVTSGHLILLLKLTEKIFREL